jgi:LPXTG-motif cell wall-anchored protein
VIETKKKIAILTVAVAALALTALIAPVSAVPIGNHTITFVSHTYDSDTCISRWTYEVTSSSQSGEGLSHWVMDWCNASALERCSETCEYVVNDPGGTGVTGIKLEGEYEEGIPKTVWFELKGCGNYNEADREVGTKAGNDNVDDGSVTGPIGLSGDPCAPVPELPTIILLGAGLLTLAGYVGLRRKKK